MVVKKILLFALVTLFAAGCAAHHHGRPHFENSRVLILDKEHRAANIVVVHKMPGKHRKCWRHGSHWHCRR